MPDPAPGARLPNLFVPGAAKSATSTLHILLGRHPEVCMSSPQKEPHFFADPDRGPNEQARYLSLFADCGAARYRGESSTGYFVFPGVVEAIAAACDDPRFIVVLRNPCDRTWSHYTWLRGLGFEPRGFRRAVEADAGAVPDFRHSWKGNFRYYTAHSDYGTQVARYVEAFGRDHVHVTTTEQLRADPGAALAGCFEFLGLPPVHGDAEPVVANPSLVSRRPRLHNAYGTLRHSPRAERWLSGRPRLRSALGRPDRLVRRLSRPLPDAAPPRLDPADRAWIADRLGPSVQRLRQVTGMDLAEWSDDFPVSGDDATGSDVRQ